MVTAAMDPEAIADLARTAMEEGTEERALPIVRDAAVRARSARLWQWVGLLQRSLDEHEEALRSFAAAATLDRADPSIAHGRAHTAFEAGLDAVDLFETARRLGQTNGDILVGLAAARVARGDAETGAKLLESVLSQIPGWVQGHMHLAQLRSTMGHAERATESLEQALAVRPELPLWDARLNLDLRREDYGQLARTIERARNSGVNERDLRFHSAVAASALSAERHPRALFELAADEPRLTIWRIRHLIRVGAADEAGQMIDVQLRTQATPDIWPYALIVWRLLGDPRNAWLERDEHLVQTIDLPISGDDLKELAGTLRKLHRAKGEYLDQSVRGGTQTDGPLFSRIDPPVRALRAAVVSAVKRYVDALPDAVASHPLLAPPRDRRIRFAGSWSVRLRGQGRHVNHVHPQGWISSALYVSLPELGIDGADHSGWLTLGEPDTELNSGLAPTQYVKPQPARLVLFPSWMWHGTTPFEAGERLTVAFDVAPPR